MCEGKQCKPARVSEMGKHLRPYSVYLEPEGCIFKHLHYSIPRNCPLRSTRTVTGYIPVQPLKVGPALPGSDGVQSQSFIPSPGRATPLSEAARGFYVRLSRAGSRVPAQSPVPPEGYSPF